MAGIHHNAVQVSVVVPAAGILHIAAEMQFEALAAVVPAAGNHRTSAAAGFAAAAVHMVDIQLVEVVAGTVVEAAADRRMVAAGRDHRNFPADSAGIHRLRLHLQLDLQHMDDYYPSE